MTSQDETDALKIALTIFTDLVSLPAQEQEKELQARCGSQPKVMAHVRALLAADASPDPTAFDDSHADGFIEHHASDLLGGLFSDDPLGSQNVGGSYRVLRQIGEGGMGAVYEAEQLNPRRRVALKVVRPGRLSQRARLRFQYEAHVMGRLEHPNIARLYDADMKVVAGRMKAYLAMEFIDGLPIDKYVASKSLTPDEAIRLFLSVCDAVEHAHRSGVIHRDLKPANILVDSSGTPKVLDFGVARSVKSDSDQQTLYTRDETLAGELIGTLAYMAPEQISSPRAAGIVADQPQTAATITPDTRADIYSLGVVLYKLLTTKLPIDVSADPVPRAIHRVLNESPAPLSLHNRKLAGDLGTIIEHTLAKDPSRRYPSVAALREDLSRYLQGFPIHARSDSTFYVFRKTLWRHRSLVASLLLFVTLIGVFGVYSSIQSARNRQLAVIAEQSEREARLSEQRAIASEASARAIQYSANIGYAAAAMAANDVSRVLDQLELAPASMRDWEWRYLKAAADTTTKRVPFDSPPPTAVSISPDHRYVAASTPNQNTLTLCDLWTSMVVRKHAQLDAPPRSAIHPNSSVYAYAGTLRRIYVRNIVTGDLLWSCERPEQPRTSVNFLGFSPDGNTLLVGGDGGQALLFDARTGSILLELHMDQKSGLMCAAYTPDSASVIVGERNGLLQRYSLQTGELEVTYHQSQNPIQAVAVSPDGKRVITLDLNRHVFQYDVQTAELINRTSTIRIPAASLIFAPDSKSFFIATRELLVSQHNVTTGWGTYYFRGSRGYPMALSFAPDGKTLAAVGEDRFVSFWDITARSPTDYIETQGNAAAMSVAGKDPYFVTATTNGHLHFYNRDTLVRTSSHCPTGGRYSDVQLHPTLPLAAFVRNNQLQLLRYTSPNPIPLTLSLPSPATFPSSRPNSTTASSTRPSATVRCMRFSPDGTKFFVMDTTGTLHMFDVPSSLEGLDALGPFSLRSSAQINFPATSMAVLSDNGKLAFTSSDGRVGLFDLSRQKLSTTRQLSSYRLVSVETSPDQTALVVAGDDGLLQVISATDLSTQLNLAGHNGNVSSATFNPSGTRIASSSVDRTVRLWNAKTGAEVLIMRESISPTTRLAFTPSGIELLALTTEQRIMVFSTLSSKP